MIPRRKVTRQDVEADPYVLWNEFVDLLATSDYDDLSPTQRVAHLAFLYDSEVQNGGHLQYFENRGTSQVEESIRALNHLGAQAQSDVLRAASTRYESQTREEIGSVREYVAAALEGEFDDLDQAYYACDPELATILQTFLDANEQEFIERIE
ncbi:MAG: DMP19 family protein [bacterium]|nr:DMP19 family protein [bacterium]